MNALVWIVYLVFGVAAVLTVVRIIRGPSILDRAVASDVLLTEVMCVLGADMVINHHTEALPVLLVMAAVGVFGSIAIARFVARKDADPDAPPPDVDGDPGSGRGTAVTRDAEPGAFGGEEML